MEYRDLLRPEIPDDLKRTAKGIIILQAEKGTVLHPVVAKLVEVLSSDDPRNHSLRKQLVITNEGGALAAVSNKRMLDTLEVIGDIFGVDHFSDAVSAMYCSSAGVANGAVFMPHVRINGRLYSQTFRASERYPNQFAGTPFNNVPFENGSYNVNWKLIRACLSEKRPLVNVGFLAKELNQFGLNPPDQSPNATRLVIIGTSTDSKLPSTIKARRVLIDSFVDRKKFLEVIRKATFIPLLSGWELPDFVDGGLVDVTGISTAFEVEGKRIGREVNVLALTNIPEGEGKQGSKLEGIFRRAASLSNHGLLQLFSQRYPRENDWKRHYQRTDLCIIAPPNGIPSISPLEKNPDVIRAAGDRAVGPVLDAFGITDEYQDVRNALIELMPFPKSPKVAK